MTTYDQEERDILTAYETGQMTLSKPSQREIAAIKAAAAPLKRTNALRFASMTTISEVFRRKRCKWEFPIKR
jgi:hypothetical protein